MHIDLGTLPSRTVIRNEKVWEQPSWTYPFGRWIEQPMKVTVVDIDVPPLRDGEMVTFGYTYDVT